MAHGGYGKRRVAGRPPLAGNVGNTSKNPTIRHKDCDKKAKIVSIRNQIRSVERLLRKALPVEVKNAQEKRLEELKRQADLHVHAELERKMALRCRKVKFSERRKIERAIRRLERLQRAAVDNPTEVSVQQAADIVQRLGQLKEDLEYVRFFPKTEKYISLFIAAEDQASIDQRNKLRSQIKANLAAAAASGVEPEETGSEDDGALDTSEDEFFLAGSSSDDADADDEWTDMSSRPGDERDDTSREVAPSSPRDAQRSREQQRNQRMSNLGKASAQVDASVDSQEQGQSSTRMLMPPPRVHNYLSSSNSGGLDSRGHPSSSSRTSQVFLSESASSQSTDQGLTGNPSSSTSWDVTKATTSAVHSCNSDAQQKPRRKRLRLKKRKR